jgi:ABC-type bacteriocin/lantibiotic exporter with double-glycine peptidase domain
MQTEYPTLRDKIRAESAARAARNAGFEALAIEAHAAGLRAVAETECEPMAVSDGRTLWVVNDGPCGFAWIKVPANSAFGRWALKRELFRKSISGGAMLWVSDFNQSHQRKQAYAHAYAEALRAAGIEAFADSRLD